MKTLKSFFSLAFLVALLAGASFAQQQGAQTLSTTTLSSAISTTNGTTVTLASITNVTATAAVQTVLWVDTEAMTVVTNTVPSTGTTVSVTRGSLGTKAELHASGRTVYVSRPNLFQNYNVAGACTKGSGLATTLPWINVSNGNRYECYSGGEWFRSGIGSQGSGAITAITSFCSGTVGSAETEYLNGTGTNCSGQTTLLYQQSVATGGELANLRVASSATETAAAGDVITVFKNGSATTITCTIPQTTTKLCSDTTHSVAVVPGDLIGFRNVSATSGASANISATVGIYGQ